MGPDSIAGSQQDGRGKKWHQRYWGAFVQLDEVFLVLSRLWQRSSAGFTARQVETQPQPLIRTLKFS